MKKAVFIALSVLFSSTAISQTYQEEIAAYQANLADKFSNPETSPLDSTELASFKGLDFFPVDTTYKVKATFVKAEEETMVIMKTPKERTSTFYRYGQVHFELKGKSLALWVYYSKSHLENEEYKDYLFLPYTDLSNGENSYGAGRYLDLWRTELNDLTLDFNESYNPYCAYSGRYACAIPPIENHLEVAVEAGVRYLEHH